MKIMIASVILLLGVTIFHQGEKQIVENAAFIEKNDAQIEQGKLLLEELKERLGGNND